MDLWRSVFVLSIFNISVGELEKFKQRYGGFFIDRDLILNIKRIILRLEIEFLNLEILIFKLEKIYKEINVFVNM